MGLFSVLAAAAASFCFGAVWYMVLVPFGTWYCPALATPLDSECGLGGSGGWDDAPCARGQ